MISKRAPLLAQAFAIGVAGAAGMVVGTPCRSQTTAGAAASPRPAQIVQIEDRVDRREPIVQHTVIEDGGAKIDELIVRGQIQHVVVTPKVGTTKAYEIVVGRDGRPPIDGTGGATSAVGKRVWNVLAF